MYKLNDIALNAIQRIFYCSDSVLFHFIFSSSILLSNHAVMRDSCSFASEKQFIHIYIHIFGAKCFALPPFNWATHNVTGIEYSYWITEVYHTQYTVSVEPASNSQHSVAIMLFPSFCKSTLLRFNFQHSYIYSTYILLDAIYGIHNERKWGWKKNKFHSMLSGWWAALAWQWFDLSDKPWFNVSQNYRNLDCLAHKMILALALPKTSPRTVFSLFLQQNSMWVRPNHVHKKLQFHMKH